MSAIVAPPRAVDLVWRLIYRVGFPMARVWWRVRRPQHEGALVAVHLGASLLLVRSSYRREWNFPGGGLRAGESPQAAALRELAEEVGLAGTGLVAHGSVRGVWDGRRDRVHLFVQHLERMPELRLDGREIVAARMFTPEEWSGLAVTRPVAAYLAGLTAGEGVSEDFTGSRQERSGHCVSD